MSNGRYIHFGITKEIEKFINTLLEKPQQLTVNIHIDGVNIADSSDVSLWTILCMYMVVLNRLTELVT